MLFVYWLYFAPSVLRGGFFIGAEVQTVYLTRRNLKVLLSKLDRNKKEPGSSECTIVKQDTMHPKFPCSDAIRVVAVEDGEYYTDREAGEVHEADEASLFDSRL